MVSIVGAQKMGAVQDLVLNPDAQHVVAIRIKLLPEGVVKTVSAIDARVGHDAVTTKDPRSVGEEELTELEGTVDLATLLGTRVLSHSGNILGNIEDVEINEDLDITGYKIGKGALSDLFRGQSNLPAVQGMHYVKEMLMVPDEVARELERRKAA